MANPYWPLFDLRLRTSRLEIRLPTDEELVALATLAAAGVHDPDTMPFTIPWTDASSPQLERSSLQYWWTQRGTWTPEQWTFTGAVFFQGRPVGCQDLVAADFARLRVARTGSWLGRTYQGQGLGTEMREAIVHLAFAGLGATEVYSGAWHDNIASQRVSASLGYRQEGTEIKRRRERPDRILHFVLDRSTWERRAHPEVTIDGLEACLELFGIGPG